MNIYTINFEELPVILLIKHLYVHIYGVKFLNKYIFINKRVFF